MQLWQMDVTGSVFLADGTEVKSDLRARMTAPGSA